MLVLHLHDALSSILHRGPYVLILVGKLIGVRVQLAVRSDDAVAVEVVVARVILVVVAAVGIFNLAQLGVLHVFAVDAHRLYGMAVEPLVNEVPVEATLIDRIFPHEVPVFLQIATRVAHRMVVFALYERLGVLFVLAVFLAEVHGVVHRTIYVCAFALASLFILHGTALVLALYPFVCLQEVVAHHGLVAQAPCHNRRVVEIHRHVMLVALHNLLCKHRFLGCGIIAVVESVALLVSLGNEIDAI